MKRLMNVEGARDVCQGRMSREMNRKGNSYKVRAQNSARLRRQAKSGVLRLAIAISMPFLMRLPAQDSK